MSGLHPIQRIKKIINLYDDLICTQLFRNSSLECLRKDCGKDEVIIDFLGMYYGNRITYFYLINTYPALLPLDYKRRIRAGCRGETRVSFYNLIRKHNMDWSSPEMRTKLAIMRENNKEQAEKNVDAFNLYDNIAEIGTQEYIEASLAYMAEADRGRKRTICESTVLMTISGERGEEFDATVSAIEDDCKRIGIHLDRVLYDIPEVLQEFSPFRHWCDYKKISNIPIQVLPDEIVARYNNYAQGILGVGGKRAAYFGTDIFSSFPVFKLVKPEEEKAEIWLCMAETGGGKSFYIKSLLLQLLANNINGTIMDVEGFEYAPLGHFMSKSSKVVTLNMGEGQGKYFDPVEIPKQTGIEDIDKDAKTFSVNFTSSVLKVLLGRALDENSWLDTIINDIVAYTYARYGVSDDRRTWQFSEGLTLYDVYDTLRILHDCILSDGVERQKILDKYHMKSPEAIDNVDYAGAVEQALAIFSTYFTPNGLSSSLFKERVLVTDIADADLVICSFGLAGKSEHALDKTHVALMQLSAAQISHQRSIFSKAKGKFNFKLWEEFQRWGNFPDSDKTISVAITGGRKLGDINIVITNNVKQLLDADRFALFQNKTSYMVGAIDDRQVREELARRLSIPNMIPELNAIASASIGGDEYTNTGKSGGTGSLYRYSFLIGLDRSKYGIVKMLVPPELAKSDLFRTGVALKGETA